MLTPIDIAKEAYEAEMQRLEHLRQTIPFISGSIVSLSVGLFYFIEKVSHCFEFSLLFQIAVAACIAFLAISGGFLIFGDFRYGVIFMNRPDEIEDHRTALYAHDEKNGGKLFEDFVAERYREAASKNGVRNRVRGRAFFYAKVSVASALVPFLFVVAYYMYYQVFAEGTIQCT